MLKKPVFNLGLGGVLITFQITSPSYKTSVYLCVCVNQVSRPKPNENP